MAADLAVEASAAEASAAEAFTAVVFTTIITTDLFGVGAITDLITVAAA